MMPYSLVRDAVRAVDSRGLAALDAQCATTVRPLAPPMVDRQRRTELGPGGEVGVSDLSSSITPGIVSGMAASRDGKVRENRLRRMADRQGLKLTRYRRRDPRALDYGLYWLAEVRSNTVVTPEKGMTIDEIEDWLTGPSTPPRDASPPTG